MERTGPTLSMCIQIGCTVRFGRLHIVVSIKFWSIQLLKTLVMVFVQSFKEVLAVR